MKRYIRSSKGEYIDEVDGVKIYWDSDDGVAYIYTEPHGKGRMEFPNREEAEEWILENHPESGIKGSQIRGSKSYTKCSYDVSETNYSGYCFYQAGNDTWGWDARRYLHELSCARGYVKFPNGRGGYYRPSLIYMFDSKDSYDRFKQMLSDSTLDWHVKIENYRDMPEGVVIIEED